MFKRNYYYLIAGLSNIRLDGTKPKELSLEFKNELADHLHTSDYDLAKLLYLQYDNKNLLNLLLNLDKQFTPLGNYTLEYLNEQIKDPTNIVEYMAHLINSNNVESSGNSNLIYEHVLQALYYKYVFKEGNSFLKQWFRFERDIKNVFTAINCRKYNYDIKNQLISVEGDNEVYNIIIKSPPKVDILADNIPFIDEILKVLESEMDITNKERELDFIKLKFLDNLTTHNYFTIEIVLSYIVKLGIVERWAVQDEETGKGVFNKLVNDIKKSYVFPEEFSLANNKEFAKK